MRAIDPVVACICGKVPFKGPFAIGHECVAEVTEVGPEVRNVAVGQTVVVPWAVSCGTCAPCRRGLTSKCSTTTSQRRSPPTGSASRPAAGAAWCPTPCACPFADHMLVPVPEGVPAERVAAAGDNLADAWRSVVTPLAERPGGSVLIIGGGARASACTPPASRPRTARPSWTTSTRIRIAARWPSPSALEPGTRAGRDGYDVVVEASSRAAGLRRAIRALAPGGVCTAVGYYLASGTRVPLMRMYATDATLRIGVSHARAVLPDLLAFVERTGFAAERVSTLTADWDDAPAAYAAKTTKVVLTRDAV